MFFVGKSHTFTNRGDAIIQGENEFIVKIIEYCRDVTAYQLCTYHVYVIRVVPIQKVQCVGSLNELINLPRV